MHNAPSNAGAVTTCPRCLTPIRDDDTIQQMDGAIWHARCKALPDTTIHYIMTPDQFMLRIPVGALAGLSQDSHTRMLAMLNEWILRHKPTVTTKPA